MVCPQALSEMDEFKNLDNDIEGSAKRWKKLVESEAPEKEIFPKEWKNKTALQKLCMVRCMRRERPAPGPCHSHPAHRSLC